MFQNFPNPFNPVTTIQFTVPEKDYVTIKVFDIMGREVTTLVNEHKASGEYKVEFNASDLPSGIYYYRMQAGDFISSRKLILLK